MSGFVMIDGRLSSDVRYSHRLSDSIAYTYLWQLDEHRSVVMTVH